MRSVTSFSIIEGLHGLIGLADSDPGVFEQIRRYQLLLSPRRRVGNTLEEYREILSARRERLKDNHCLFADATTTVLQIAQQYKGRDGDNRLPTAVLGMITYDLNVGPAYTDAEVWDLFVPEILRQHPTNISRQLIELCHRRFKLLGVTTARAKLPHKRSHSVQAAYLAAGYYKTPQGGLEYRFASEG
jgi:hypothetical protein